MKRYLLIGGLVLIGFIAIVSLIASAVVELVTGLLSIAAWIIIIFIGYMVIKSTTKS